jgi:excisionase family DNA binding protein
MTQSPSTPENGLASRRAYTIAEAAGLLGVHKVSVYRRIYSGEIKVLAGFGRLMITETELQKFLGDVKAYVPRRRRRVLRLQRYNDGNDGDAVEVAQ